MDDEIEKTQEKRKKMEQQLASMNTKSIPVNDDDDAFDTENEVARKMASFTAPKEFFKEVPRGGGEEDEVTGFNEPSKIIDRGNDPFLDKTPGPEVGCYEGGSLEEAEGGSDEVMTEIAKKKKEGLENKEVVEKPAQKRRNRWDQSQDEGGVKKAKSGGSDWDMPDSTPGIGRWDATPHLVKNRWDETPTPGRVADMDATPVGGLTPGATPAGMSWDATPKLAGLATSTLKRQSATPTEGATPAAAYTLGVTPVGVLELATPTPDAINLRGPLTPEQYNLMRWEKDIEERNQPVTDEELDAMFPQEGYKILDPPASYYFVSLLNEEDEEELSPDEQKERKIMKLLLKVKNGTPPQRKTALRQLTDKAREFGAGPLFNRILPLLMQPTLEDLERHLLVKVIDRVLYKLDELVLPICAQNSYYYARVEGREIISNLCKAAGLATTVAAMRPDIDNFDEYVRNTTAQAFNVVASHLSKKSWQAPHTGIKIVQQIAILIGCAVFPHLRYLVEIIEHCHNDENQNVRTITALSPAALAVAAAPYGIESFEALIEGFHVPLVDAVYASYYTKEVMVVLIREFQSPDEEMTKIVLKAVKQCVSTEGVEPDYIRQDILPEFFRNVWIRRMALDRRNYKQLVETTVEIANKVCVADIVGRILEDLKDESESYRRMVMETIDKVVANLEQTSDNANVMLNGFGAVLNARGQRVKPYLPQICGTIKRQLNNKSAKVRQQAADLISRIAVFMKQCGEEQLMDHLGVVLYEYLGEEYPEVLGSVLGVLKAIVNIIGMTIMTPPIKDMLPWLTPILKNRHEKVQRTRKVFVEQQVNTFGYISKALGPQDVLATLLNNLKVQERQNGVSTTVAIAIVAETCSPFTVLPALMNEYCVPELNVPNGVLKSLSFLFEYVGEMGKDYIYAVTPLREDALLDWDLVHRQPAASAVKHMALGVAGLGCEDALVHLFYYVWPNIFETSPDAINAVMEAIEGMRVAGVYWKIYNSLYIGAQDSLVASYPILDYDENNIYSRPELNMFI
ncbi:unnamed protein product [Withania somnifera]